MLNCGMPSMNSLVPSIGSMIQTRGARSRSELSLLSSESQPSSG